MKVLQVCQRYYPGIGGVETHVQNISEILSRKYDVTVFTGDPSGRLPREEKINDVLVKRFKSFSPSDAYHISFEMARELKKAEFDIVHGHNYHALPLYFSRYARSKKYIVPPRYHGHGHTSLRKFLIKLYKTFGKKIFEEADNIIALSNYEKELLLRDFAIDESKIQLIPNGLNIREFEDLSREGKEKTILCVGRLEEYKGMQYVIQTLPLLDKNLCLKIVGKGPYKHSLVKLVDRLRLGNRIKFYQNLPRKELLRMYAKAGVFVLLSRGEAFGNAVAEALASKTPCIVATASALLEWIDNKNCFGIGYPINNAELAELITKVVGKEVGDVKLWSWDEVAREIAGLYESSQD